jgi:hypothetical protein
MLAGCATSAPPLPPDTTSVGSSQSLSDKAFSGADLSLSCTDITAQQQQISKTRESAHSEIESNRTQNQVAGYFGAFFVVPLAAAEGNKREREAITQGYQRQDELTQLAALKQCPQL